MNIFYLAEIRRLRQSCSEFNIDKWLDFSEDDKHGVMLFHCFYESSEVDKNIRLNYMMEQLGAFCMKMGEELYATTDSLVEWYTMLEKHYYSFMWKQNYHFDHFYDMYSIYISSKEFKEKFDQIIKDFAKKKVS